MVAKAGKKKAAKKAPKKRKTPSRKLMHGPRDHILQGAVVLLFLAAIYFVYSYVNSLSERPYQALDDIRETILDAADTVLVAEPDQQTSASQTPIVQKANLPTWMQHAAKVNLPNGVPRLVLIIDDLGLAESATRELAALPAPLTLSFLPYANYLPSQTALVKRRGHELLVHIPMVPKTDADPGPKALLAGMDRQDFMRRLSWNLSRFDGYVGINNHMGSLLTENEKEMQWVMDGLKARGLFFLDSVTTPHSVAYDVALKTDVPSLRRDVFIDNVAEEGAIIAQLEKAKTMAMVRGVAIAIGHPYPETLAALKTWLPTLASGEVVLAPLSAVMQEKYQP